MIAIRRTGTYLYSGSELIVLDPQETMPDAAKRRRQLTLIRFRLPCSVSVRLIPSPTAPLMVASVPAGAFHTPRRPSIRANRPAMYPDGGNSTGSDETPVGSSALIHGK